MTAPRAWLMAATAASALACLAMGVVALAASPGWAKSRAPSSTDATGLGAASVYWDNPQAGAIGRSGGPPSQPDQSFITGIRQIDRLGVAVDRQYVYWTDGPWIGRANLDGSGVNQQFIRVTPHAAFALAVDDQHLYWVGGGPSIWRANLDGSGVDSQFTTVPGGNLSGVAVDSAFVYWTDRRGMVGRANLDGTGITQSFVAGAGNATGVAVDGRYIYWTQVVGDLSSHGPYGGAIGRANLDGTGANSSFITGASFPWGVTVDYGYIYWANGYTCDYWTIPASSCGGGTIGRANLDGSAVNQSYITADQGVGTGCASNLARCGPYSVALSAPGRVKTRASKETQNSFLYYLLRIAVLRTFVFRLTPIALKGFEYKLDSRPERYEFIRPRADRRFLEPVNTDQLDVLLGYDPAGAGGARVEGQKIRPAFSG